MKRYAIIAIMLTAGALGFRLLLALRFPTDQPDDGRFYANIARNVIQHGSYSVEVEEPFIPTYVRVPGYPMFLAGVYRTFGIDNNRAVRVIQAGLDTVTCWVIALLALAWVPADWEPDRRRRVLLIALALAASCPFGAIYVAAILTETWAMLLVTACVLASTLALKAESRVRGFVLWVVAGLVGGAATLVRPDSGFFVAAIGSTAALVGLVAAIRAWNPATRRLVPGILGTAVARGVMFSIGFALALAPWTIRNARLFGVFEPLAPAAAVMPQDFVPHGYVDWLRTWVDEERYTDAFEYGLDLRRIHIEKAPSYAFDSTEERDRVAALLDRYNNIANAPLPTPPPPAAPPPEQPKSSNPALAGEPGATELGPASDEPASDEDADSTDEEEASDEEDPPEEPDEVETVDEGANVRMTPEIDAAFGDIARERIARHPGRYYIVVPVRRIISLWFDTHSQYYPFQGWLFPVSGMDPEIHQQYWLSLFCLLTWGYTLLAAVGACLLWKGGGSRAWVLLLALLIVPRLLFLSSLENPEPRYTVEFFILILAAASLALSCLSLKRFLQRRPAE